MTSGHGYHRASSTSPLRQPRTGSAEGWGPEGLLQRHGWWRERSGPESLPLPGWWLDPSLLCALLGEGGRGRSPTCTRPLFKTPPAHCYADLEKNSFSVTKGLLKECQFLKNDQPLRFHRQGKSIPT